MRTSWWSAGTRTATGEAATEIAERTGRRTTVVTGDVAERDDVHRIVDEALDAHGRIDVLVNNAGVCFHRPALEVPDEEFAEVFDVNVTGLWRMSKAVAPSMIEAGGGSIVNVGSISAMIVNRPQWQPAYNASKAAVHQLTKSLAAEWAPHHIRVNAIAPGYVKTEMAPVDEPRFRQHWIEDAPMRALRDARGDRAERGLPRKRRGVIHHRCGARHRRGLHVALTLCATRSPKRASTDLPTFATASTVTPIIQESC